MNLQRAMTLEYKETEWKSKLRLTHTHVMWKHRSEAFECPNGRDRPIWVQPIPIPIDFPGRYFCRYRYIWIDISATDTDTDIFPNTIFGR